jgi:hypothetical protein
MAKPLPAHCLADVLALVVEVVHPTRPVVEGKVAMVYAAAAAAAAVQAPTAARPRRALAERAVMATFV